MCLGGPTEFTLGERFVFSRALSDLIVLDGGSGTELERRGFDTSGALWSARLLTENPDAIEQLHYDYYAAGADCVISATFQATYEGFASAGFTEDQTTALLLKSVVLVENARDRIDADTPNADRKHWVAASVGPYGARLQDGSEFHGNYNVSVETIAEFHEERLGVLAESGADVLACETIPILDEARALALLLNNHSDTEAWFTFSSPDGVHTSHGENLSDAAALADRVSNVVAVGVNCLSPLHVSSAINEVKKGTAKPLIVYPNSGEKWNPIKRKWDGPPDDTRLAVLAPEWIQSGAKIIGGCCRTGPRDIADLTAAISR